MKIQVISKTQKIKCFDCEIIYSKFDDPRTLDSFDVNIIDLQDEGVWRHDDDTPLGRAADRRYHYPGSNLPLSPSPRQCYRHI